MNDWNNVKEFWGASLVRCTPETLEGLPLSDYTRRFLLEVGLPIDERLNQSGSKYHFTPDLLNTLEIEGILYIIIGYDQISDLGPIKEFF